MTNAPSQQAKIPPKIFIGKWSPEILSYLGERPYRHGELRRQLRGVSQRVLTKTLRDLESAGLITRRVTGSKSVSVEYSLTPVGMTFLRPLSMMCQWANHYRKELTATVRLIDIDENNL